MQENQFTGLWCGELRRKIWRLLEDPDSSTAAKVVTRWWIYRWVGLEGMVIIGHRSFWSTFGANNDDVNDTITLECTR